jgi:glycosyltransferase involved in cell wall biosynthesis
VSRREHLVLLTAAYPFGNKSETFLETEIQVLADRFVRIDVLPSRREQGLRPLPPNVDVVEMDWLDEPSSATRRKALASREAAWAIRHSGLTEMSALALTRARRLRLDILARNILKFRSLRRWAESGRRRERIFYDYWLENSTLALALLRRAGAVRTGVARAHNFDLYGEDWGRGGVPFQSAKARGLDAVFAVSADGASYLERHVAGIQGKVRVSPLGVADPGRPSPPAAEPVLVLVSCSSLIPDKRVDAIPEALSELERPVRWIHLGDGPERPRVAQAAARAGSLVEWELRGHLANPDVLRFFREQHVDVFVSLSRSEGLPVSMMEAQSFGIPIVACDVGGVREIVTPETGVLMPATVTPGTVATAVLQALEPGRFDAESVRAQFKARFDASLNYNHFADALIALHQGQAATA